MTEKTNYTDSLNVNLDMDTRFLCDPKTLYCLTYFPHATETPSNVHVMHIHET